VDGQWAAYRRFGFRRVPGWLEGQTLDILTLLRDVQDQRGIDGAVAEIGVYHGRLFIGLQLLVPKGTPAVAVDSFVDQSANPDEAGGNLERFTANVQRWGDWSSVVVVQVDSTTLKPGDLEKAAGGLSRFFSVDGGHSAETTTSDLSNAEAALAGGGVVIVDDVFNEQWPGVMDGVAEHLHAGSGLIPFAIGFNKTYFTNTPESAAAYRTALREHLAPRWRIYHKSETFRGHPVELLMRSPLTPRNVLRRYPVARKFYFAVRRGR
jgi:hypothetical protein